MEAPELKDYKNDTRPKKGWWAPGNYMNHCRDCGCGFIGDKRAGICADCAYDTKPKVKESTVSDLKNIRQFLRKIPLMIAVVVATYWFNDLFCCVLSLSLLIFWTICGALELFLSWLKNKDANPSGGCGQNDFI